MTAVENEQCELLGWWIMHVLSTRGFAAALKVSAAYTEQAAMRKHENEKAGE